MRWIWMQCSSGEQWSCRLCRSFCKVRIAARCDWPCKRRFTRTIIDVNGGGSCSFLLPRLLLFRPARGGNIHKGKLAQRFQDFSEGTWSELLRVSTQSAEDASKAQSRKRRHRIVEQEFDRRAARALSLVQMGELSSGRQALEGASLAPGTRRTLEALRDPIRRPPVPRDPLPHRVVGHMPDVRFSLEEHRFAGMTTDHLRPLLDHVEDTHLFFLMGEQLAQARVPPTIHASIRQG